MATGRVPTTANSPLTTKGDIFGYSTAPARLAVGSDGETIVADSSTSTGLRWQVPVNFNPVLNSAFQVWQRGTANVTTASAYTADRWQKGGGTHYGVSRQVTGDTTNLPFIQYCARVQRTAGSAVTGAPEFTQSFETINSIPFAGKTVTFSFYARAGANFSATSNALSGSLWSGTGTDQNILTSYTGFATVATTTATLTTTWQRFSVTGTVASTASELSLGFSYVPTGTAGAADFFEITGVQVEVGSVATPFKTYAGTIQGELAACQRYYYRQGGTAVYETLGSGWVSSTTQAYGTIALPVSMRVIPTSIEYSTIAYQDNGGVFAPSAVAFSAPSRQQISIELTCTGLTAGRGGRILTNNSTNGYLAFSAEL